MLLRHVIRRDYLAFKEGIEELARFNEEFEDLIKFPNPDSPGQSMTANERKDMQITIMGTRFADELAISKKLKDGITVQLLLSLYATDVDRFYESILQLMANEPAIAAAELPMRFKLMFGDLDRDPISDLKLNHEDEILNLQEQLDDYLFGLIMNRGIIEIINDVGIDNIFRRHLKSEIQAKRLKRADGTQIKRDYRELLNQAKNVYGDNVIEQEPKIHYDQVHWGAIVRQFIVL